MELGVIEGFFGPAWPHEKRLGYAPFLQEVGGDYYIYAPKQDPHLRKQWRSEWKEDYLSFLRNLSTHFRHHGVRFGVALSPFGLSSDLTQEDCNHLEEKLHQLTEVGVDLLGLFFDDMPVTENLASVQIKVVDFIHKKFPNQIVFCPSFYSYDPILEKVFGKMPEGYWEEISQGIPAEVAFAWTGPKVISPEISHEHLREVRALLKRKPFIWENLFANDGPKNCKFLKLRPFDGRSSEGRPEVSSWGFNMMNQPELSKITFLASVYVLKNDMSSEDAFQKALSVLLGEKLSQFIQNHQQDLLTTGLDQIPADQKSQWIAELANYIEPAAREIESWLKGEYNVGSECLTD